LTRPNATEKIARTKSAVFIYAVGAVTGTEVWHFDAGTGCATPPGDCGFGGPSPETNEVEFDEGAR
jgi:hypothetical protein